MTLDLFVRYLHFVSIFVLVAAVFGQHFLVSKTMTRRQIRQVQKLDVFYALSTVVVLVTGFAQWFWVGKPAAFYSENPIFHSKIFIFLLVGILSAYPSVFFAKRKKGEDLDEAFSVPGLLIWTVRVELLLLLLMPLLASLMARGIGIQPS